VTSSMSVMSDQGRLVGIPAGRRSGCRAVVVVPSPMRRSRREVWIFMMFRFGFRFFVSSEADFSKPAFSYDATIPPSHEGTPHVAMTVSSFFATDVYDETATRAVYVLARKKIRNKSSLTRSLGIEDQRGRTSYSLLRLSSDA